MDSNPPPDYTPPLPDPPLTREEQALVGQLTEQEIKAIDDALLSNACERWRKVSAVVGFTMFSLPNRRQGIPDVFYAQAHPATRSCWSTRC